jgi:hypothetical protein
VKAARTATRRLGEGRKLFPFLFPPSFHFTHAVAVLAAVAPAAYVGASAYPVPDLRANRNVP